MAPKIEPGKLTALCLDAQRKREGLVETTLIKELQEIDKLIDLEAELAASKGLETLTIKFLSDLKAENGLLKHEVKKITDGIIKYLRELGFDAFIEGESSKKIVIRWWH